MFDPFISPWYSEEPILRYATHTGATQWSLLILECHATGNVRPVPSAANSLIWFAWVPLIGLRSLELI